MKTCRQFRYRFIVIAVGLLTLAIVPAALGRVRSISEPVPCGCLGTICGCSGPRSYTLAVSGTRAGGAQVSTTVRASLDVGLAVIPDSGNLATPVGLVPLGHLGPGAHTLPWDLRVGGHLLAPGRYEVALEIFSRDGHPSGRGFPHTAFLTISPDGHTSAVNVSIPSTKSKTNWTAVVIGVIAALALGALVAVAVGRRRRSVAS